MAQLPTYRRQVIATGTQQGANAGSSVSPSSPVGAALGNIGQSIEMVGATMNAENEIARKRTEDQAAITVANTLSEGQVYWQQNFNERSQQWTPGQPDMKEGITTDFDKWTSETESKLPTEASKNYFKQHAIGMKTKMLTGAYTYQEKATTDALNAQTAVGVQSDETVVYGDAGQFDAVYARRMEPMLARNDLTEAEKITRAAKYKNQLSLSAERGELERDPATWYAKRFGAPASAAAVGGAGGGATSIKAAIFGQESGSGAADTSKMNAQGVTGPMQIQQGTFDGMKKNGLIPGDWDISNPAQNKQAGDRWIDYLSDKYSGDPSKIAAAYYGGEKAVRADGSIARDMRNLSRPGDPTVGQYVDQVVGRMKKSAPDAPLLAAGAGADAGPLTMPGAGWGNRPDGSAKGNGFLGPLKRPDGGVMTEYSVGVEINGKEMDIPTLVPTLTKKEVDHILNMNDNDRMPDSIVDKAVAFAEKRIAQGKPVFAGADESPGAHGAAGQPLPGSPKTYTGLDWEQQSALRTMAETKIKQGDARYKATVTSQMKDAQAMHRDGVIDPVPMTQEQFTRAFPEGGDRLYAEYQNSRSMASDISGFKSAPAGDIAATIEQNKPVPGDGYAAADERENLRLQAAQRVIQMRNADPAGYVVSNTPELAGQQAAINDPSTPAAQKPILTQKFVTDSLAEQARLGIMKPKILTPAQADSIGQQAMSATRPEDSANLIGSLEAQYGKHFPRVFDELVSGKKIANEMLIIPNLPSPAARETVSRLARVKETDLTQGIDAKDQKTVKDLVVTNLEAMGSTVPLLTEQSSEVMNAYETTMRKMAYGFMAGGQSPSDAVTRAQSLLLGQYQFAGTMRLPTAVNESAAKQGAQSRLYDSLDGIDVPRDLTTGARSAEEQQTEWMRTVRARPLWFTNDDDSGVGLWAQGSDGVRYRVTKGGAPVSFTWDQLQLPTRTPAAVPQDMGRAVIGTGLGLRRAAAAARQP